MTVRVKKISLVNVTKMKWHIPTYIEGPKNIWATFPMLNFSRRNFLNHLFQKLRLLDCWLRNEFFRQNIGMFERLCTQTYVLYLLLVEGETQIAEQCHLTQLLPVWVHYGKVRSRNIARIAIAVLCHSLLRGHYECWDAVLNCQKYNQCPNGHNF